VGGSVSGLAGSGLTLALNGANNLNIGADGSFTFPTGLASGTSFNVTVVTQPNNPAQLCTVSSGTGTIATSNTAAVSVTCFYGGRFAYVADLGTSINGISAYAINQSTGALTALAGNPYGAGNGPISLAIRPDGKFLYGVNGVSPTTGAIWVYAIDNATGVLTEITGSPFITSTPFEQIAIDPAGKFAFTADFNASGVSAFTLDPNTGAPTLVGGSPFPSASTAISVAVDPKGKFVFVGNQAGTNYGLVNAYTIDPNSGALTPVAGSPFPTAAGLLQVNALAVSPNGSFVFAAGYPGVMAYTLDASSGALTPTSGSPFSAGQYPVTVAVDPSGQYLYVGNGSAGPDSRIFGLSINQTSGTLSPIAGGPYISSETPYFVAIDPSGDLVYVANPQSDSITVYSLNKSTGALTATGGPLSNGVSSAPRAIAILK
jgi:6-phosphogluconolactonase (cycloisomerase 2 family)